MLTPAQCVLGILLIAPYYALPIIRGMITEDDFEYETERALFKAALLLSDNGETIDPLTIQRKAVERGVEIDSGYLIELMNMALTTQTLEGDCQELVIQSSRRRFREALEMARELLSNGHPLTDISVLLRKEAEWIADRTAYGGTASNGDTLRELLDYRMSMENGQRTLAVRTGYDKLDDLLGGGMVSEGLYVLAARPGGGKTTFALNIAENIAKRQTHVLFITLEMSLIQLAAKRAAIETGLSGTLILNAQSLLEEDNKKIATASAELSTHKITFNRAKSANVNDVERMAAGIKDLGIVIIDYLGLLKHTEGKSLYEKVTYTSGALKRLARTLGVPVLCLAQLNREVDGRSSNEPRMSDLRDSGAIEQDADGIILLSRYPEEPESATAPAQLKVNLAKNRHGGTGTFDLNFYLKNGRIRS